jgi:hypothetical protein
MLDGLELAQLHWLVVAAVGLVIGALALVVGHRAVRRPDLEAAKAAPAPTTQTEPDPGAGVAAAQRGHSEKRRAFRRKGKCTEVELSDQEAQEPPWRGWVLDRSIKGLRLMVDKDVEVGALYNVRVCGLNPTMPWMAVKALHSKPTGQGFEIGLEFVTPPTWNILLLFG